MGPRPPPRPRPNPRPEARALRQLQPRPDPRPAGVRPDRRHLPRPFARPRGGRPGLRHRPRHHPPPRGPSLHIAFEHAITLDHPWTDFRGQRHPTMAGRPVAMHAMRGISAHSNGFQTCRAIHLLQLILGTVDPGGFRFEPPYPKPVALTRSRTTGSPPATLWTARRSASRAAPRTSRSTPTATRSASTGPSRGRAAGRARHDAHGDRQRRRAATPIRSRCCSSTWRTWPGTRR